MSDDALNRILPENKGDNNEQDKLTVEREAEKTSDGGKEKNRFYSGHWRLVVMLTLVDLTALSFELIKWWTLVCSGLCSLICFSSSYATL